MQDSEWDINFKNLFIPLTTKKAVLWIIAIGIIVYFNMLFNSFVGDDLVFIVNNSQINAFNIFSNFGPNLFNTFGQYRPMPAIYFTLARTIFADNTFFYHIIQLSLHILTSISAFFLFRKFLFPRIAFLLALIFLIHPMNVESAAYIAQTVNPLILLPGITAILISTKKKLTNKDFVLIFILLLLSILTKETGILFLFLLLLYSVLYARKNLLKLFLGGVIIIGIYIILRLFVGHVWLEPRLVTPIEDLTFFGRVINMPLIALYYIKTFFFPISLGYEQQWVLRSIQFSTFFLPLFIDLIFFSLLGVAGFYIYKFNRDFIKPYIFFVAWFIVGLLFHIQIFPLDLTVEDRWFYFPIVGLLGLLGIVTYCFIEKNKSMQKFVFPVTITILLLLFLRTIVRNANWQNNFTLFTHDIQVDDNFNIEENLGYEYQLRGDTKIALEHFQRSVALRPNEVNLHNLGYIYQQLGDFEKAKKYYQTVFSGKNYQISLPHKYQLNSYISYIAILMYYGSFSQAESVTNTALLDYPNSSDLLTHLALIKYKLGDKNGALDVAKKALALNQSYENEYIYQNILKNQQFTIAVDNKSINF